MRGILLAVVGPALVAGLVRAAPPEVPAAPWANKMFLADILDNPTQAPPLTVSHDFGTVPSGTVLSHTFTLTNVYDAPLQVIDVRLSSDSLTVEPPQRVLRPREQATFVVTMDTHKFQGSRAEAVYVTVGPQHFSTAVLRLTATSRSDVTLSDPGTLDFGVVPAGTNPTRTLTMTYSGRQDDWKLTGVMPPAGPVEVEVAPAGPRAFTITAALRGDALPGSLVETVNLKTNDPSSPVIPVTIRGVVQAPVDVRPERVAVPSARVGEVYVTTLIVTGNGNTPFKVEPVEDSGDGVSVESLGTLSPVHRVTLRFAPVAAGPFRKEVYLRTSLNKGTTVGVTLEANVEPRRDD